MFSLASFAMDPSGVFFANQGENEEIHLFLRRHFITNIPWILLSGILFLLPLILSPFIDTVLPISSLLSGGALFILVAFYYIVVFGAVVLASFINWYFNVYIVTNERVVDVDFINILYREISATRLNLIQDVTVKTGGVIRAIFNYGAVFIQTAGAARNIDFIDVPKPHQVADFILDESHKIHGRGGSAHGPV
jgi:membrane protein YdbS with pleckstrin-like domain